MAGGATVLEKKFIPGSDAEPDDIFRFPFTMEDDTIEFIKNHGRIMFIVRGPPGTGKDSLSEMITKPHDSAIICSADHYFRDTFTPAKRNPQSLRESHLYCHKKVKNACMKNTHPIIVKNTHMKKSEFQEYLKFAEEYNYTVIMAVSMNKFDVTPQNLARSNTKGLSAEYFEKRLRQWQECPALATGWFLGPDDAKCIHKHLKVALDSLLSDGKFCKMMNIYKSEKLWQRYKARTLLYCIAACGENHMPSEIKNYYFSSVVQENYGRCFSIKIVGFLVTEWDALAVVELDKTMVDLGYGNFKLEACQAEVLSHGVDSITESMQSIDFGNALKFRQTVNLAEDFECSGKTVEIDEDNDEDINTNNCSLMYLAETGKGSTVIPSRIMRKFMHLLLLAADKNGLLTSNVFQEVEDSFKFCRLSGNAWFIKPAHQISLKTVFTGLYV